MQGTAMFVQPKPESVESYDLAIVGVGFSGVAVAYHLNKMARAADRSLACILFEPRELIGAGLAYSTSEPSHLLNVPASKMSIDESDPKSFTCWLERNRLNYTPHDFVPRHLYQRYLADMLASCELKFKLVREAVTCLKWEGKFHLRLSTAGGAGFLVKQAVVAIGNSPVDPFKVRAENQLQSPWDVSALELGAKAKDIAVIGTGLTAIDLVLALEQRDFKGKYTLISRHGLLPQPHAVNSVVDTNADALAERIKMGSSLRAILEEFRTAVAGKIDWHNILDALRPHIHGIWKRLAPPDRRRFLRHLRPYWDTHRHRVPAESICELNRLIENGRLKIVPAKVSSYSRKNGKHWISLDSAHSKILGPFDTVFNCMGLWSDLRRCKDPLIDSLLESRLADYDELFLGLRAASDGQLLNAEAQVVPGIYTLGSLRRGELWESTAVREVRQQAQQIASSILANLDFESQS